MVDLEQPREISGIDLVWEQAFARSYHIETSLDGENWEKIFETKNGYGDEPPIRFAPRSARYVRITGTKMGTRWGMSLWEMKVF